MLGGLGSDVVWLVFTEFAVEPPPVEPHPINGARRMKIATRRIALHGWSGT